MSKNAIAGAFYTSSAWMKCREAFLKSKGGLCEECAAKGYIVPAQEVHHIKRITADNLNDANITLSWNNLKALCRECHLEEHGAHKLRVDTNGHIEI